MKVQNNMSKDWLGVPDIIKNFEKKPKPKIIDKLIVDNSSPDLAYNGPKAYEYYEIENIDETMGKYMKALTYNENIERVKECGYTQHWLPAEYFEFVCDALENKLNEKDKERFSQLPSWSWLDVSMLFFRL